MYFVGKLGGHTSTRETAGVGGASFGPPRHSLNEGFGENVCLVATDGQTD